MQNPMYWMQNPNSVIAEPRFCIQYALVGIYKLRVSAKAYWMQNPSPVIAEPSWHIYIERVSSYYYMQAKAYWMQNQSCMIAEPRFCIQYTLAGIYILMQLAYIYFLLLYTS